MKITFTIDNKMGIKLTHFFNDKLKLVSGFQELEDMLGDEADLIPRMVLLKDYLLQNRLWGKAYENYFITNVERTQEGEEWLFTKAI